MTLEEMLEKYRITLDDVLEIVKEYGGHTKKVWLSNCDTKTMVMLKYDSTRRYFMSQIKGWKEEKPLQRVPKDVFINNIEYLMSKGYYICF